MTRLVCDFPDKVRFYDLALKDADQRVFVAGDEEPRPGTMVEVEIRFGPHSTPASVTAQAKVVGRRPAGPAGQQGGSWVQFSADEIEALRRALSISEGEGAWVTARGAKRHPCDLPVLVDKPIRQPLRAKNISDGGVCLNGIVTAPVGQTVRLNVEFSTETITIFGKVAWRRDEQRLTGVEFRFQNEAVRDAVADHVRRIAEEKALLVAAKPTVLIVDDDVGTLGALERVLTYRGYGTVTATSGPEALSAAREQNPALVLLDILLPGMNGIEVCRALKRDVGTSRLPVVLTSVLPRENLALMLQESGALVALPKPYRFETLGTLVDRLLGPADEVSEGGGPGPPVMADSDSVPMFARCNYESDTLRLESQLREASEQGGVIASSWGDPVGTQATLTLMRNLDKPVRLRVEVTERFDWGLMEQGRDLSTDPGIAFSIIEGGDLSEYRDWLRSYREGLEVRSLIVVVDDDRAHLELLEILLRQAGYGVLALDSPAAVVKAVESTQPVLVIMDYMMPGQDGATVCRALKANEPTAGVPVWLYSSISNDHLQSLARDCGADGWVRKGTRPTQLLEQVDKFMLVSDEG